jgi:2-polyprenyl-3-methyl-5-hydroxy-6-metoxy-1,4-benzoquinol methylase
MGFEDPALTWNRRFDGAGAEFLFGTEPNAWLTQQSHLWRRGERVLAVADGEGRNSAWLAAQGLCVDAFDVAERGVAKARDFATARGVEVNYAVADVDALAWPEALYDGVAAIFVQFADPAMRTRLFTNLLRCLKPDGWLVLQGYTPKQLDYRTGGPPFAAHMYTEPLLRTAFAGHEVVALREYEEVLAEGKGHNGRSALIGVVVRKRTAKTLRS